MLSYTELKKGKLIIIDNQPHEVMAADFLRMQKRRAVVQTKLKNLITGKAVSRTIHQNERLEEADIEKHSVKYLYNHREEYWFCELDNPSQRFSLSESILGDAAKFFKLNSEAIAWKFNDKIISVKLPIKVDLKVKNAPPSDKGDTASGGKKPVTLETGAVVQVPFFIKEGDIVRINTETGEYAERAEKMTAKA